MGGNKMKNRICKVTCDSSGRSGKFAYDRLSSGKFSMRTVIRLLLPICVLAAGPDSFAAAPQNGTADYILPAADGWPIHVTYYESSKGKQSPIVVLLTAANGDEKSAVTRNIWKKMATYLQKDNFAVLAVDLRKHGDSLPDDGLSQKNNKVYPIDYRNMVVGDMEAVKSFLLEKHEAEELNIRKLAIVSSGSSCLVGAAFALNDWNKRPYQDAPLLSDRTPRGQDVRAIVMFSPRMTRGFNSSKILKPLSAPQWGIAFRIYHSSKDRVEEKTAKRLFRVVDLKGEEYDELRSIEAAPVSGEEFLTGEMGKKVQEDVASFLKANLEVLSTPWRSRKSPLDD